MKMMSREMMNRDSESERWDFTPLCALDLEVSEGPDPISVLKEKIIQIINTKTISNSKCRIYDMD